MSEQKQQLTRLSESALERKAAQGRQVLESAGSTLRQIQADTGTTIIGSGVAASASPAPAKGTAKAE